MVIHDDVRWFFPMTLETSIDKYMSYLSQMNSCKLPGPQPLRGHAQGAGPSQHHQSQRFAQILGSAPVEVPSGNDCYVGKSWNITMLFIGKSTSSMAMFHCYVSHYHMITMWVLPSDSLIGWLGCKVLRSTKMYKDCQRPMTWCLPYPLNFGGQEWYPTVELFW